MDTTRLAERVPVANTGDNRATLRRSVALDARVRDRSASRFSIRVVDLSRTGFRAETAFQLRPGSIVWITLPGLQGLEAEVAWQRGEHVGAAFRQPLHPAVFEHIVELSR
ncbi:MAG: PilZ domain-containing protein [Pseudomonadota bacterium]